MHTFKEYRAYPSNYFLTRSTKYSCVQLYKSEMDEKKKKEFS